MASLTRPVTPAGSMRVTSALQVVPSAVEFDAFEPDGTCYVATLAVKNTSDRTLRYRVVPPSLVSPFRVLARSSSSSGTSSNSSTTGIDLARTNNPTVKVPPGLSVKYDVTFQIACSNSGASTAAIYHDALQIRGEDHSVLDVPLLARRASPVLDVETTRCDLGLVVLAQRAAQVVRVRNVGARTGRFDVEALSANASATATAVTVTPVHGVLAPGDAVGLRVEVVGSELGAFRSVVRIRIRECATNDDAGSRNDTNSSRDAASARSSSTSAVVAEKIVDVCGRVVAHSVELVLAAGLASVTHLHFGALFAGETRTIATLLRNNGPQPLRFKATLAFGGSNSASSGSAGSSASYGALGMDDDREAYERRKELQVAPAEGRVEPFSQLAVTFTYSPRRVNALRRKQLEMAAQSNGSGNQHDSGSVPLPPIALSAFASIQCVDLQAQNLTLEVSGSAFVPQVELTPSVGSSNSSDSVLDFGDVKSHDRVDILLTLKNTSSLPVRFAVPKVAHFGVRPSTGRLDVLQSQSLVATFAPSQLGAFSNTLELTINSSDVLCVPIRVRGRAAAVGDARVGMTATGATGGKVLPVRGVTAVPADFAPQYKFLLPDEARATKGALTRSFQRVAPYERAALNGTAAIDEYEFAGTNNTHLTYCVKELARRADHSAGYHEYLAACRREREQSQQRKRSAATLKSDVSNARSSGAGTNINSGDVLETGVNLGMTRQSGVAPRALRIPRALQGTTDPLWLEQATHGIGISGTTDTNTNSANAKTFFDDTKFVKKKFKAAPATQAEIAECALALDFEQLARVVAGPKTLHFGKLSVNSVATRSLSVQNHLAQHIVVALHLRGGSNGSESSSESHIDELAAHTQLISQVVPPHALAGFDISFCSMREQFYQQPLAFSINGVHMREVTVVADVAPIVVELSTHELTFEFSYLTTNLSMTLDVALTNTSDSVAPFQWTLTSAASVASVSQGSNPSVRPDSSKSSNSSTGVCQTTSAPHDKSTSSSISASIKPVFEVFPSSGSLGPAATLVCQVVYTPPAAGATALTPPLFTLASDKSGRGSWLNGAFRLDVTGGKPCVLACRALVQDLKVVAKEKKVDFGTISIGIERDRKVTLSNATTTTASDSASTWAVYYASIEPAATAAALGLSVAPSVGTVLAQDAVDVAIKIVPHKPAVLDASGVALCVLVRGGKSLRIPIVGSVVVPDVCVAPAQAIAFGDVVLGVSVPRVIALENRSAITASLALDLGAAAMSDEFAVVIPPKLLARLEDVSSVFIPIMDAAGAGNSSGMGTSGKRINTGTHTGTYTDTNTDAADTDVDARCSRWQICIPANTTVSFHLVFTPTKPGAYDHVLPLQISGVSSSARPDALTRSVQARAVAPRLQFSTAALDFHKCVITREGIRKVPYTKFLTLTNTDTTSVKWHIDTAQLKQQAAIAANPAAAKRAGHTMSASATAAIFHLAPDRGELAPGENVKIRVSFLPLEAVEYVEDEIPLMLDDAFYIHIRVKGEGIHPHLSFSATKVVLPTVPLGVVATATVLVHSTGYDHLDLTYRVPLDLAKAPVTLHFPKGKVLSIASPTLPIVIRFVSTKSVAFSARIEFFDADGAVFCLPIAGCTENCVLTNFAFLESVGLGTPNSGAIDIDNHGSTGMCIGTTTGNTGTRRQSSTIAAVGLIKRPSVLAAPASAPTPAPTFEFYAHSSMRFPIYLLPTTQCDAERAKETQQRSHAPTGMTTASHGSGLIEVDSAATICDDSAATTTTGSSSSMTLLHGSNTSDFVDPTPFSASEVAFLLQYLNANFLRTAVTTFPFDFADTQGKPLYELLDMVCTKKPSNLGANGQMPPLKVAKASSNSNSASGPPLPSKRDLLVHYTTQYTELLKFLKSYGAMLHDVAPEHLLSREFYVRACEDPRVDPALLSTPALASLRYVQRRHALEREWPSVSAAAWMRVLYQVVKCFLLFRITAKSYAQQVPTLRQQQAQQLRAVPRVLSGSNVYSEAEMVLLQWVSDNVRAMQQHETLAGSTSPVEPPHLLDVERDLRDGRLLFHLVASHIPTLSTAQSEFECFQLDTLSSPSRTQHRRVVSASQLAANAHVLQQTLVAFGIDFGIDPATFLVQMTAREMVVLLLHLHQTLPQFIPKATIVFRGVLGQTIEKSIELRNPSTRALRYTVFLDTGNTGNTGAIDNSSISAFTIAASAVVLEPGRTEAFVVTCRPRFSRKVTARLVFQSVRDPSAAAAATASGATMVFLLESDIVARRPVRVIEIEAAVYEKRVEDVVIENQFAVQAAYRISMTQTVLHPSASAGAAVGAAAISSSGAGASATTGPADAASWRKSMQVRGSDRRGSTVSSQVAPVSSSNTVTTNSADAQQQVPARRGSVVTSKNREDVDFTWCMSAQQPFYLPEFGSSGSVATSASSDGLALPSTSASLGVVPIKSQSSATVKLEFLPLLPGTYKCQLLFLDERVGEFMYEVHAVAHLPASLDTLKFQCEAPGVSSGAGGRGAAIHVLRELVVPVKNPLLTRALASYVDRASGHLKTKLKDGLRRCEDAHHTSFHVELNSPFFTSVSADVAISSYSSSATAAAASKLARGSASSLAVGSNDADPASPRPEATTIATTGTEYAPSKAPVGAKANQARLLTPRSNTVTAASPNSVLLDFQPKGAGVYACKLLLRSHHTVCGSSDLRVYDVEARVKEPSVKTLLEFAAPARHSIVQEIPVSNPTDTPWTLRATFSSSGSIATGAAGTTESDSSGATSSMFTGPAVLHVPPKKSASYPLTFAPKWIVTETTSFTLLNPVTQQQFDFELRGVGDEPLALDHVVITCQARTSVVHMFDVVRFKTDPPGTQHYTVESDLRDVKGASTAVIPSPGPLAVPYALTFSPIVSGTYFGSITFTNVATNEYMWYTIEANVRPPEPEATLDMVAVVRSAIGVEIRLANPLDHDVAFAIELQGDGLLGPATFTLGPLATGVYELVYSPLMVTTAAGVDANDSSSLAADDGAVLFSNDEIGQFWYRLQLQATPAPAIAMQDMTCAVGDVCAQPIVLTNPSDRDLLLQYRVSNPRNFTIKGVGNSSSNPTGSPTRKASVHTPRIALQPFGHATVLVEYTPSSLTEFETAIIVFDEPNVVSDWVFTVRGIGKAPSVMKPIVVAATVYDAASTLFTFKNPFADTLCVDVELVVDDVIDSVSNHSVVPSKYSTINSMEPITQPVFDILLKKRRHIHIEAFGHLQVPIAFHPPCVCDAHAAIVIRGTDVYSELVWRYPIIGTAEAPVHPRSITLACPARDAVDKRIVCELLGAPPDMAVSSEVWTVEWDIPSERFGPLATAAAIERALSVQALPIAKSDSSDTVSSNGTNTSLVVSYNVRFEPLRPYRGSIYMVLKKQSGGSWRFEVVLDVSDPPVDDTIAVASQLNATSAVTFTLRNPFRQTTRFIAAFSAGSSSAFTVFPTDGVLPPFGVESDDSVAFVVAFTPTAYGKMQSGHLTIVTEDMQWTFHIKGTYPDATSSNSSKGDRSSSSNSSGPNSSSSVSSSASRHRLGIASGGAGSGGARSISPGAAASSSSSSSLQSSHKSGTGKDSKSKTRGAR